MCVFKHLFHPSFVLVLQMSLSSNSQPFVAGVLMVGNPSASVLAAREIVRKMITCPTQLQDRKCALPVLQVTDKSLVEVVNQLGGGGGGGSRAAASHRVSMMLPTSLGKIQRSKTLFDK